MEKIIVVDDEQSVLDVISEVIENAGFEVTTFTESRRAIEALENNSFDILITDLKMPDIDGIQLTKKKKKVSPEIEIIIITGYASLETALDAVKSDVYNYILKPFNVTDILLTIQKAADSIRLRRLNQKLNKKVEKALSDLTILHEVSKIINSSDQISEVLNFALGLIETSIELNMITVMLYDEKTEEFFIEKAIGFSDDSIKNFRIRLNNDIIGQAIKLNETVNISSFENDESYKKSVSDEDKEKIDSFIAIPLNAQGQIVGLLTVHQIDSKDFEEYDKIKLLEVMSINLAPMLLLAQYKVERQKLMQDSLFGAKNELYNIIKKAGDYKGTLSVLILRLYLKRRENPQIKIFDVGDSVFSYIINNITPIDSALKVGLDSFLVILHGKTKILTEELAAKIKRLAEADQIMQENGFLLDYGYADFPMDGQTFDVLISKAQASLWKFVKK